MVYIGVDLGGTNIAVGVVNENWEIVAEASTKTLHTRPYQEVIRDMAVCADKALEKAGLTHDDVKSIGIGIPGCADENGNVIFCTNLGWKDIPLSSELQKYINKPVYVGNDATVAGLAESYAGVSKGCSSSVFLTLGTGVGGGIIIDGKPWNGVHGVASELGHMILVAGGEPCSCGNRGCLERYTSATAIIRMAKEAVKENPDCAIMKKVNGDVDRINAKTVIDAAKENDPVGVKVFEQYTDYLAMACNNVIQFLDPDMVVLGGGVSYAGEFLVDAVRRKVPNYILNKNLPYSEIKLAQLRNEAGIIGAALLGRAAE